MKKIFLAFLLFISLPAAYAQCNFKENKVDDFTGAREITAGFTTVHTYKTEHETGAVDLSISYSEKNGYTLSVINRYYSRRGTNPTKCFNGNSVMMIKTGDGSVLELPAIDYVTCGRAGDINSVGTVFMVSEDQLQQLKAGIDKFRLSFTESQLDGTFGPIAKTYGLPLQGEKGQDSKYFFFEWAGCIEKELAADASR